MLNEMDNMNLEMKKDLMLATLTTYIEEVAKRMTKVEAQCKRNDKCIPSYEWINLKNHEAKYIEEMFSTILLKVTKQNEAPE